MTPHQIVAATLRQLAQWSDADRTPMELFNLATTVENSPPPPDDMCCPMCQETECDTGCPLESARR